MRIFASLVDFRGFMQNSRYYAGPGFTRGLSLLPSSESILLTSK